MPLGVVLERAVRDLSLGLCGERLDVFLQVAVAPAPRRVPIGVVLGQAVRDLTLGLCVERLDVLLQVAVAPPRRVPLPPPPAVLLDELTRLPISTWRYLWDDPDVRHLGPMAQDFAAAFGLGENERWIETVDADGVNMVAIQELARRLRAMERRLQRLEAGSANRSAGD